MYFDLRLGYRKKFLYDSEQKIMIELGELRKQILDLVVRIDGLGEPEQDAEKHRVEIDELNKYLETLLGNYDHLFEELRQDIWEVHRIRFDYNVLPRGGEAAWSIKIGNGKAELFRTSTGIAQNLSGPQGNLEYMRFSEVRLPD